MQVSLPNSNVKLTPKLLPKTENLLTWRATTLERLTRDKHDQLAIKYLKFENSRRKSTVTNNTSDTKRYKNILSRSTASKIKYLI